MTSIIKDSPQNFTITQDTTKAKALLIKAVYIYVLLVIIEGALRKWFLPFLSTPLLVVRDPIALWAICYAVSKGLFPKSPYIYIVFFLGLLALLSTLLFGHGNVFVGLFGLRILVIHFPFMFLMGSILEKQHLNFILNGLLLISIISTLVVVIQFSSPQTAWINQGVGGDESGSGFSGAMGYSRVSGLFSFTNGNSIFYQLMCPIIYYFWLNSSGEVKSRLLLILATLGYVLAVPLSVSRSVLFQTVICTLFAFFIILRKPDQLKKGLTAVIGLTLVLLIASQLPVFSTATEVLTARFEAANRVEGGMEGVLVDRFLGGLWGAITNADFNFFGAGLGMGSNVGAMLLAGKFAFLGGEGTWGRHMAELGFILGLILVLVRISLSFSLAKKAFDLLGKGEILPWLLTSSAFLLLLNGQWGQPTSLGFFVIAGGLLMSSINTAEA